MRLGCVALLGAMAAVGKDESPALSEAARQQLQRDKVVITPKTYRQVFSAYESENSPFFITTDCVIAGWHSLLQQSLLRMEEDFAARFPEALDHVLASLPRKMPEGMTRTQYLEGLERAKVVLGVASRLAGGKWLAQGELGKRIEAEAKQVEKAEGVFMPTWLRDDLAGSEGMDYAVFKPTGFYAEQESLRRYFRALRWLQTVPFAVNRENSVAAMALMAPGLKKEDVFPRMSRAYDGLMGKASLGDAIGLGIGTSDPDAFDLESCRRVLSGGSASEDSSTGDARCVVFASRQPVDVRLFQSAAQSSPDRFPESLEVAALLGSRIGLARFPLQPAATGETRLRRGDGEDLYSRYLEGLRYLTAPADVSAPAFMKSGLWEAKSTSSQLSGWALACHDLALQREEMAITLGVDNSRPTGFVEPNPAFYRHFGKLAAEASRIFERAGVMDGAKDLQVRGREAVELSREIRKEQEDEKDGDMDADGHPSGWTEKRMRWMSLLFYFGPVLEAEGVDVMEDDRYIAVLEKIAAGQDLERVARLVRENGQPSLKDRWLDLVTLCAELGDISHKELRGLELSSEDEEGIGNFGERLGTIMGYEAEGWKHPRDDAPAAAAVFNQPGKGMLIGAVARPREIRVLYPWKGEELECTGAILPFHEFRSDRHLSDGEWKTMLDGPNPPASPDWLQPLMVK